MNSENTIMETLEMLNNKIDKLTEMVERLENKRRNNFKKHFSVENYKKSILIKFDYNRELIEFIKNSELGGLWISSMKAWMFPKSIENEILTQIGEKFSDWAITDLRN